MLHHHGLLLLLLHHARLLLLSHARLLLLHHARLLLLLLLGKELLTLLKLHLSADHLLSVLLELLDVHGALLRVHVLQHLPLLLRQLDGVPLKLHSLSIMRVWVWKEETPLCEVLLLLSGVHVAELLALLRRELCYVLLNDLLLPLHVWRHWPRTNLAPHHSGLLHPLLLLLLHHLLLLLLLLGPLLLLLLGKLLTRLTLWHSKLTGLLLPLLLLSWLTHLSLLLSKLSSYLSLLLAQVLLLLLLLLLQPELFMLLEDGGVGGEPEPGGVLARHPNVGVHHVATLNCHLLGALDTHNLVLGCHARPLRSVDDLRHHLVLLTQLVLLCYWVRLQCHWVLL